MFSLILRHGDHLREAWHYVVRCIISLNEMDLISLMDEEDQSFEGRKKKKKQPVKEGSQPSGLLSFIPSFWASEPVEEEINQEDIDAENLAKQIVDNCSIKSIIAATW